MPGHWIKNCPTNNDPTFEPHNQRAQPQGGQGPSPMQQQQGGGQQQQQMGSQQQQQNNQQQQNMNKQNGGNDKPNQNGEMRGPKILTKKGTKQ